MTKQRKLRIALLIAIALSGGAWLTYSVTSGSTPADKGYELYLSGDTDGAFRYFSAEAEKDPQAAYALSVMYLNGNGVPVNALLGYQWLERAAKAGNKNALYNLGYYRYHGMAPYTGQDPHGITSLKAAAQAGVREAQELLGSIYLLDKYETTPSDVEQARKYMTAAADQGSFFAKFALGYIAYEYDEDYKKAVKILTPLLSEQFLFPAMLLSRIYDTGGHGIEADPGLAKKYRYMAFSQISSLSEEDIMPKALSLYGAETTDETAARLKKLEKMAENGNLHARYALYDVYMQGMGAIKNKEKALSYLLPLINQKDPKALYTWYLDTKTEPDYLKASAEAGYPDALYLLYQIHRNIRYDDAFDYDRDLSDEYLKRAADAGHRDALIDIIRNITNSYQFSDNKTNAIVSGYLAVLLGKYPDDPEVLMLASERYGDRAGNIYDPARAFELNKKAAELSPLADYRDELAYKYARGIGVEQDVKKAVGIYKSILKNTADKDQVYRRLAELYFSFDTGGEIDEKEIIAFLKKDIEENENYRQAHFYAGYLLRNDPVKNREQAMKLYKQAREYTLSADVHQAKTLISLNSGDNQQALNLMMDMLKNSDPRDNLPPEEWNDVMQVLLTAGKENVLARQYWVQFALHDNNAEAQKQIEPLIGHDPDVTYYYALLKLEETEQKPDFTDDMLRPDIELMQKAAEAGNQNAAEYIVNRLQSAAGSGTQSNRNQAFLRITGLTERDIVPRLKQCADTGSQACMYELGEIYYEGKYGEKADMDTAIAWYEKIPDRDYRFTESRLKKAENSKKTLIDLNARVQKGDADAAYELAYAWKNGDYGLIQTPEKWHYYLKMAAGGGNENAVTTLIDDYKNTDTLSPEDKKLLLSLYDKLPGTGNNSYLRNLGMQYLEGSNLVSADRLKAREYFTKAGDYGKSELAAMNEFELNVKLADESPNAAYETGYAYLLGRGVRKDPQKALLYLQKASDTGHDRATILLADTYAKGAFDKNTQQQIIEPDWDKAIILMRAYKGRRDVSDSLAFYEETIKPAHAGDGKAMLAAGMRDKNYGNYDTARYWFAKSTESGYLPAFCVLADATENPGSKMAVLRRGAEKGDSCSDIQLAAMQLRESSLTPDSPEWSGIITRLENGLESSDTVVSGIAFSTLADLYNGTLRNNDGKYLYNADNKKYLALMEPAAEKRTDAQLALFSYYRQNNNMDKALSYLQKAHDSGDLSATQALYKYFISSEYCRRDDADPAKAEQYLTEWLKKSDYPENTDNQMVMPPENMTKTMGDAWLEGFCNKAPDPDKAIAWYTRSLEYNNTHALEGMYNAYVSKKDAAEAYYYGSLAGVSSREGDKLTDTLTDAERDTVLQRIKKKQEYEQYGRYEQEIDAQRQKAENGDAMAAFSLGVNYARGERVPEDTEKMLYFYELAGKNGYARAYNVLGNLYRKPNERGIPVDGKKALAYFDAGAKLGDSNTAHLAGDMLYFGQAGLEKDYPQAARYYEMTSLEQGSHHELAKYKVAWIYYHKLAGTGSDDDLRKVRDNLILSEKYGNKDAAKALKEWDFSRISKPKQDN